MRLGILDGAGGGQLEGLNEFLEAFVRWSEPDTCLVIEISYVVVRQVLA